MRESLHKQKWKEINCGCVMDWGRLFGTSVMASAVNFMSRHKSSASQNGNAFAGNTAYNMTVRNIVPVARTAFWASLLNRYDTYCFKVQAVGTRLVLWKKDHRYTCKQGHYPPSPPWPLYTNIEYIENTCTHAVYFTVTSEPSGF